MKRQLLDEAIQVIIDNETEDLVKENKKLKELVNKKVYLMRVVDRRGGTSDTLIPCDTLTNELKTTKEQVKTLMESFISTEILTTKLSDCEATINKYNKLAWWERLVVAFSMMDLPKGDINETN